MEQMWISGTLGKCHKCYFKVYAQIIINLNAGYSQYSVQIILLHCNKLQIGDVPNA